MQERKKEIEELESILINLINQRKEIQTQINILRNQITNKKIYDKYYRGIINHNFIKDGITCQEIFGKKHCELTEDEKRKYYKIKQAERRKRVKAERSGYERN